MHQTTIIKLLDYFSHYTMKNTSLALNMNKPNTHFHTIMTISDIGKSIRERRKMLSITLPDLAEMAQISINTLYKIERGEANPSVRVLNKIANILGLEISIGVKKVTDQ